jgi:hypothetical protein
VPMGFDHLTVDIDLNTFWVLHVRESHLHLCAHSFVLCDVLGHAHTLCFLTCVFYHRQS